MNDVTAGPWYSRRSPTHSGRQRALVISAICLVGEEPVPRLKRPDQHWQRQCMRVV